MKADDLGTFDKQEAPSKNIWEELSYFHIGFNSALNYFLI
jgi:hypothetical protein